MAEKYDNFAIKTIDKVDYEFQQPVGDILYAFSPENSGIKYLQEGTGTVAVERPNDNLKSQLLLASHGPVKMPLNYYGTFKSLDKIIRVGASFSNIESNFFSGLIFTQQREKGSKLELAGGIEFGFPEERLFYLLTESIYNQLLDKTRLTEGHGPEMLQLLANKEAKRFCNFEEKKDLNNGRIPLALPRGLPEENKDRYIFQLNCRIVTPRRALMNMTGDNLRYFPSISPSLDGTNQWHQKIKGVTVNNIQSLL